MKTQINLAIQALSSYKPTIRSSVRIEGEYIYSDASITVDGTDVACVSRIIHVGQPNSQEELLEVSSRQDEVMFDALNIAGAVYKDEHGLIIPPTNESPDNEPIVEKRHEWVMSDKGIPEKTGYGTNNDDIPEAVTSGDDASTKEGQTAKKHDNLEPLADDDTNGIPNDTPSTDDSRIEPLAEEDASHAIHSHGETHVHDALSEESLEGKSACSSTSDEKDDQLDSDNPEDYPGDSYSSGTSAEPKTSELLNGSENHSEDAGPYSCKKSSNEDSSTECVPEHRDSDVQVETEFTETNGKSESLKSGENIDDAEKPDGAQKRRRPRKEKSENKSDELKEANETILTVKEGKENAVPPGLRLFVGRPIAEMVAKNPFLINFIIDKESGRNCVTDDVLKAARVIRNYRQKK